MKTKENADRLRTLLKSDINKWSIVSDNYPTAKLFHFAEWVSSKKEAFYELDVAIHLQWILPSKDKNEAAFKLTEAMGQNIGFFLPYIDRFINQGFIEVNHDNVCAHDFLSDWIEKNIYDALIRLHKFNTMIHKYLDGLLNKCLKSQCRNYALWGINEFTEYVSKYLLKHGKQVVYYIDSSAREYDASGLPRPVYTFDEINNTKELKDQIDMIVICSRGHARAIQEIISESGINYQSIFNNPPQSLVETAKKPMSCGIVGNCIPKAGTHLLIKLLFNLPNTEVYSPSVEFRNNVDHSLERVRKHIELLNYGRIFAHPIPWSREIHETIRDKRHKMILIMRDPRDICVSFVEYMNKSTYIDPFPILYRKYFKGFDEKLNAFIRGLPEDIVKEGIRILYNSDDISREEKEHGIIGIMQGDMTTGVIYEMHEKMLKSNVAGFMGIFTPWMSMEYVCTVKFEDLIGPNGGGTIELQTREIERICEHLNLDLSAHEIHDIAN